MTKEVGVNNFVHGEILNPRIESLLPEYKYPNTLIPLVGVVLQRWIGDLGIGRLVNKKTFKVIEKECREYNTRIFSVISEENVTSRITLYSETFCPYTNQRSWTVFGRMKIDTEHYNDYVELYDDFVVYARHEIVTNLPVIIEEVYKTRMEGLDTESDFSNEIKNFYFPK